MRRSTRILSLWSLSFSDGSWQTWCVPVPAINPLYPWLQRVVISGSLQTLEREWMKWSWCVSEGVWGGGLGVHDCLPMPTEGIFPALRCPPIGESESWPLSGGPWIHGCIDGLHGRWKMRAGPWGTHSHGSMAVATFVTVWGPGFSQV